MFFSLSTLYQRASLFLLTIFFFLYSFFFFLSQKKKKKAIKSVTKQKNNRDPCLDAIYLMTIGCSGYLQRVAFPFTDPKKETYYYELHGSELYFWRSKPDPNAQSGKEPVKPRGVINTAGMILKDEEESKPGCWSLTRNSEEGKKRKCYGFYASSIRDAKEWMKALEEAVKLPPSEKFPSVFPEIELPRANEFSDDEEVRRGSLRQTSNVSLRDFEVLATIGRGSFGRVFLVKHRASGEFYAMKSLNKADADEENLLEQIYAEKSILQTISHPFIVSLRFAFQTRDRLFLVLDLLAGGELFHHLVNGNFDEYRAKFYTAQIGLAIGYLHSKNIIYRDLKPENAVLDKDGYVRLTDFGLAKSNVSEANARTFCGTPEYLAPEFLVGSPHGRAVDWWSLGIMLYEMLFGIPPFYNENQNEMYEKILSAPLEFPEEVPLSDDGKNLLQRLLDRDPDQRMQDVEEFAKHPFFHDINFEDLYNRKLPPPFHPNPDTLQNFDRELTSLPPNLSEEADEMDPTIALAGFTYNGA